MDTAVVGELSAISLQQSARRPTDAGCWLTADRSVLRNDHGPAGSGRTNRGRDTASAEQARSEGQVAYSSDLMIGAVCFVVAILIRSYGSICWSARPD